MKTFTSEDDLLAFLFAPRKRGAKKELHGGAVIMVPTWHVYSIGDLPVKGKAALKSMDDGHIAYLDNTTKRADIADLFIEPCAPEMSDDCDDGD